MFYNYVDDFELGEPKYAFESKGKTLDRPTMERYYQHDFVMSLAHFTELVPRRDMRQNFLVLKICWNIMMMECCAAASMFLDRGADVFMLVTRLASC